MTACPILRNSDWFNITAKKRNFCASPLPPHQHHGTSCTFWFCFIDPVFALDQHRISTLFQTNTPCDQFLCKNVALQCKTPVAELIHSELSLSSLFPMTIHFAIEILQGFLFLLKFTFTTHRTLDIVFCKGTLLLPLSPC